jgi:PleD family two-component response regulator
VDDYLTKPISEATLVSTLRGKMKRFRQLRNVFPKNAAA